MTSLLSISLMTLNIAFDASFESSDNLVPIRFLHSFLFIHPNINSIGARDGEYGGRNTIFIPEFQSCFIVSELL